MELSQNINIVFRIRLHNLSSNFCTTERSLLTLKKFKTIILKTSTGKKRLNSLGSRFGRVLFLFI